MAPAAVYVVRGGHGEGGYSQLRMVRAPFWARFNRSSLFREKLEGVPYIWRNPQTLQAMSKTTESAPILVADSVRGIYAMQHAAGVLLKATCNGWTCSDMDSLTYAAADVEQALEVETELARATFTDPHGLTYTLETAEGGDVLLMPY